jgi:hypothetical protein
LVLTAVLEKGLTIDNYPIILSYSHLNSFSPVYIQTPYITTSYTDPTGNLICVAYWDERAYSIAYVPVDILKERQEQAMEVKRTKKRKTKEETVVTTIQNVKGLSEKEVEALKLKASSSAPVVTSEP